MLTKDQILALTKKLFDCKLHYNEAGRMVFHLGDAYEFSFFQDVQPAQAVERLCRMFPDLVAGIHCHLLDALQEFIKTNKLNFH